jgi:L-alanine-DL-glutamate epimerase-like enolase superfamily enzyme
MFAAPSRKVIAALRSRSAGSNRRLQRIEAVLGMLEPGMSLAVDGNGTFDRASALRYVEALSTYPLAWIEEPVPARFPSFIAGRRAFNLPLATGRISSRRTMRQSPSLWRPARRRDVCSSASR